MSFWWNWILFHEFSWERCLIFFGHFFFKNDHFRYRRCRRLDRSLTVCWQTLLQIAILGLLQKQLLLSLLQSSFCLSATMKYLFTHNWLIDWNIHFSAFLFVCSFLRKEEGASLLEWFSITSCTLFPYSLHSKYICHSNCRAISCVSLLIIAMCVKTRHWFLGCFQSVPPLKK